MAACDFIIDRFDALATADDRLDILTRLVDRLTLTERLALGDLMNRKNDYLATLPAELIGYIFDHLPTCDTWRLQLVSRRWRSLLSSERMQRDALMKWCTHDAVNDQAHDPSLPNQSIEARVRHMQAIRLGRPFTTVTFRETMPSRLTGSTSRKLSAVALNGKMLAYVRALPDDRTEVVLRDLIKSTTRTLRGDGWEKIMWLALTSTHIFFGSHTGLLYVAKLENLDDKRHYRLPHAGVDAVAADDDLIAVGLRTVEDSSGANLSGSAVAVCDARSGRLSLVRIEAKVEERDNYGNLGPRDEDESSYVYVRTLLVSKAQGCVDVFGYADYRIGNPPYMLHTRFPVSSTCNAKARKVYLPYYARDLNCQLGDVAPTGYSGLYQITRRGVAYLRGLYERPSVTEPLLSLLFDVRTAKFSIETYQDLPLLTGPTDAALWKDMLFVQRQDKQIAACRIVQGGAYHIPRESTPDDVRSVTPYPIRSMDANWPPLKLQYCSSTSTPCTRVSDIDRSTMLVNESFLVYVKLKRSDLGVIEVRCFDERIRMPGARLTGCWDQRPGRYYGETSEYDGQKLPFTEGMEDVMEGGVPIEESVTEEIVTDSDDY